MRPVIALLTRPAEIFLGVIFLSGAILKATDINLFCIQINAYHVLPGKEALPYAALATLILESYLAGALLLGIKGRKITLILMQALLLLFSGLILYAWIFHDLQDCGCFGKSIALGPKTSLLKNIFLAALGGFVWIGDGMGERRPISRSLAFAKLALALALALALPAYAAQGLPKPLAPENNHTGPFARFVFDIDQTHFDLGHGEYFVAILSMSCPHCLAESPKINDLMLLPDVPPIVALCLEETEGDEESFRAEVQPTFPMYNLGDQTGLFFQLIGDEPPRFTYIRDGFPIQSWDLQIPTYEQIQEARKNPKTVQ